MCLQLNDAFHPENYQHFLQHYQCFSTPPQTTLHSSLLYCFILSLGAYTCFTTHDSTLAQWGGRAVFVKVLERVYLNQNKQEGTLFESHTVLLEELHHVSCQKHVWVLKVISGSQNTYSGNMGHDKVQRQLPLTGREQAGWYLLKLACQQIYWLTRYNNHRGASNSYSPTLTTNQHPCWF